jgi:formylglycine-generating enzyme required for sulfatase activity
MTKSKMTTGPKSNVSAAARSCCALPQAGRVAADMPLQSPQISRFARAGETVLIPGGQSFVGTSAPKIALDGEDPPRRARLRPFRMSVGTISNADFASFVEETGYVTEAECFGWSFVFWAQVPDSVGETRAVPQAGWWRQVHGTTWRAVNGPGSEGAAPDDHPVVQVSWTDARAYADWAGGRLPTEAEWEHAARGGLGDVPYPWGTQDPDDVDFLPCNIWQGDFPQHNTRADGYVTTAPVRAFAPNGYGLYNMVGNVWEWSADPYGIKSIRKDVRARLAAMKGYKLSKGGSFLCHRSYCWRYRIAARIGNSPDSATTHQGFRVVFAE